MAACLVLILGVAIAPNLTIASANNEQTDESPLQSSGLFSRAQDCLSMGPASSDGRTDKSALQSSELLSTESSTPTVGAGSVIKEGGTYQIASPLSNATISIATTEPVTLIGHGIYDSGLTYVTIKGTVAGVDLTIRDVGISNGTVYAVPALSFIGADNKLHVEGQSMLQMCYTAPGAAPLVSVPSGTDLTIDGSGKLYLYRHTTESATFGGGDSCDNGSVTVNGGTLRITGMSGGVAFGTSWPDGNFTINGGNVAICAEKGQAGIAGGKTSGNVVVNGGTLSLEGEGLPIYAEPSDGEGTLQVNGGRLFVAAASRSLPQAFNAAGEALASCTFDVAPYLDNGSGGIASASNPTGEATILVDGRPYFSGSLDIATLNSVQDARGESTPLTWDVTRNTTFTAFLTPTSHTLTVNGTTLYATWSSKDGFTLSEASPEPPAETLTATVTTAAVERFGLATFTCATNVENATYQWEYTRGGETEWLTLTEDLEPGATSPSFMMDACTCRLGCTFRCVVTAPDGQTVTSNTVGFQLSHNEASSAQQA